MADVAVLDPSCVWQPDMQKAAITALRGVNRNNLDEVSGVLYKDANGNYCYSLPVQSGSQKDFKMQARIPKGASLAGLWHTHPDNRDRDDAYFSPNDVQAAQNLDVPSFIRMLRTDQVKGFIPGKTATMRAKGGRISSGYEVPNAD